MSLSLLSVPSSATEVVHLVAQGELVVGNVGLLAYIIQCRVSSF